MLWRGEVRGPITRHWLALRRCFWLSSSCYYCRNWPELEASRGNRL